MQNHLLQMVALFAMEPPVSLDAEDIRNEKVYQISLVSFRFLKNLFIIYQFDHACHSSILETLGNFSDFYEIN